MAEKSDVAEVQTSTISVNGKLFRCPSHWTVADAKIEIRETYGLRCGGIFNDGVALLGNTKIGSATGVLEFAHGVEIQTEVPPSPGYSSKFENLDNKVKEIRGELDNVGKSVKFTNEKVAVISDRLHSSLQGPRTRSEWVKELDAKGILTHDPNFFSSFNDKTPEMNDLKTLCSGGKVQDFNFAVRVSEEPKKGIGSREHFGNVVKAVIGLKDLKRSHDCEGRNKASVGNHKPDYVQRSADFAGEQGIVVLGEIKGMADADKELSDEEVGQVLDFLQELLVRQGWRAWAYGFLTDGVRFEFFRGERRGGDMCSSFTRSGLLKEGVGWRHLSQLLQQSDEILGFKVIKIAGWTLGSSLGSGATSSVFAASKGDERAVCKVYHAGPDAAVAHMNEITALTKMHDHPHTPTIADEVKATDDGLHPVLVVTPVGERLGVNGVRLPVKAYAPLVDTLRVCHSERMCHNDVCPENMFAAKNSDELYEVFLNDWGSSATLDEIAKASSISTHKLFYDVKRMGPGEDLAALVRAVFVLTHCTFPPVQKVEELDEHMHQQWNWGRAVAKARKLKYGAIKQFFLTGSDDIAKMNALAEEFKKIGVDVDENT